MKQERLIRLREELHLILIWDEWWSDIEDEDSLIARNIRRQEIVRELNENGFLSAMANVPCGES